MSLNETSETNETNFENSYQKEDISLLSLSNPIDLILETQNGEVEFESLFVDHVVAPRKVEEAVDSNK